MTLSGKLISIEGIDGCGKDTQVKNVFEFLRDQGMQVSVYTFPNYDSILGGCIKQALSDSTYSPHALQLLFSADRAQQFQSVKMELLQNRTILTSRSKWSSYVYAVARGLPRLWAQNIEAFIPDPDVVLYLDIDEETSIARTGGSDLLEQDSIMLKRCREEYLELANTNNYWHTIDATSSVSDVFNEIVAHLN